MTVNNKERVDYNVLGFMNELHRLENIFSIDLDFEYHLDRCERLLSRLEFLKKEPSAYFKDEQEVLMFIKFLNRYLDYRRWDSKK
ncbi:MAG: hypothetical protein Q4C49_12825 [Bacillota bacterium]|nr:hypothetical protein [Bacillota bacterium]